METPILTSSTITQLAGCSYLGLKCEAQQVTGSFKVRGVTNKVLSLPKTVTSVTAQSSGNHAIALTKVCLSRNITPYICMPTEAVQDKVEKFRELGGRVFKN